MAGQHGTGMSRAAKKRAKKKQKKQQQQSVDGSITKNKRIIEDDNDGDDENINKLAKTMMDQKKIISVNEKKRQRVEDDEEEDNNDNDNDAVDQEEVDEEMDSEIEEESAAQATKDLKQKISVKKGTQQRKRSTPSSSSWDEQIRPPKDCSSLSELMSDPVLPALSDYTCSQRANCILNFLLQPAGITAKEFYEEYWEQEALLIQQSSSKHRHRFDGLLSKAQIQQMLAENTMCYGVDLNVTRYELDKHGVKRRTTLDLVAASKNGASDDHGDDEDGEEASFVQADPDVVWDHYKQGCTVRLLCPHKHAQKVHMLLQSLETEWGCMAGANAYLTPPGSSQGFAPHYDDIEAFCIQLEGKKRWKVYKPLTKAETLPRASSPDYTEDDLKDVKPVMDIVLSPGDILYMPRGWIHQAVTLPDGQGKDGHSLHLTVSAMQQWSWVDLMEICLPEALNAAAASDSSTALRDGLPIRFLDYMGAAHSNHIPDIIKRKADQDSAPDADELRIRELQESFRNEAKARIMRVAKEAMDLLDASCDQISKQFLSARQPPCLNKEESKATNAGRDPAFKIMPNMLVRLVRPGVARLALEDEKAILYHCLENAREYHGRPISPLEFEMDDGPALEQLIRTVEPHWVCVQDLFHDSIEDKVGVTQALFDEGLISIREG